MWLFCKAGFFSVVEAAEPQPDMGGRGEVLSIRARVAADLDVLKAAYAPKLGPTVRLLGRDYPYRAYTTKEAFAEVMVRVALDLSYGDFKSMVAKEHGHERAHLYSEVWSVMKGAEDKLKADQQLAKVAKPRSPRR